MRITALLICLTLASCVPAGGSGGGGGGGGGPTPLGPIAFQIPDPGSEVSAPFTMSATGNGIESVFFHVDSNNVWVKTPPWEFSVDPLTLSKGQHTLRIEVQGDSSSVDKIVTITVVRPRPTVAEITAAIDALLPGQWYEILETQMRDVDLPVGHSHGAQDTIIAAVSGGAYDTKRERYIVWGGGGDAYRNEVTVFDMATYEWIRLNDPSDFPPGGEDNAFDLAEHPDGAPVARHSFCTVQYIPEPVDRLYVGGGEVGGGTGLFIDEHTYLFDFDTLTWTSGVETISTGLGTLGALAPDNRVWQHGGGGVPHNRLSVIDVVAQTATEHVAFSGFFDYHGTSDIHPLRNEFISVGDGVTRVWDLDNPDTDSVVLATAGNTEIEDVNSPGFAYHPPSGLFVAWGGGKDVYTFDAATAVWTLIPGQGSANPGAQTSRGTFNRWRYVPSKGVFIIANSVDRNVYVYRFQ